jgi:hypothetical protein
MAQVAFFIEVHNFLQKLFYKWKLYMANIVCKNWFLFQVETKKKCY